MDTEDDGGERRLPFAGLPLHGRLQAIEKRLRTIYGPPRTVRFEWLGRPFAARLTPPASGRCILHLDGTLGILPYSVESAARRKAALALMESSRRRTGDAFFCRPDGCIRFASATNAPAPPGRAGVYALLVVILLEAAPYLIALCRLLHPPPDLP